MNGIGKIGEVIWQEVGVGEAHRRRATGPGQGASITEIRVREMRVPVEIIVDRVVDATAVLIAKSQVERGDAEMIEERSVVRARTQGSDSQVSTLAYLLTIFGCFGIGDVLQLPAFPKADFLFWIFDVAGYTVREFFQCVRA